MRTQIRILYGYSWLKAGLVFLLCAPRCSSAKSPSVFPYLSVFSADCDLQDGTDNICFTHHFLTSISHSAWSGVLVSTGQMDGWMDGFSSLSGLSELPTRVWFQFLRQVLSCRQHGVWGEEYAGGPSAGAWRSLCPGITDSAQRDAGTTRKGS